MYDDITTGLDTENGEGQTQKILEGLNGDLDVIQNKADETDLILDDIDELIKIFKKTYEEEGRILLP